MSRSPRRIRACVLSAVLVAATAAAGCSSATVSGTPGDTADTNTGSGSATNNVETSSPSTSAKPRATGSTGSRSEVTVALAGDSHTEGVAGRVLDAGLGGVGALLKAADVAVLNLETVIAADRSGLQREPKQYTFVSPPSFLDLLSRYGVDAVSAANNHGLDYGREGLARTLAARNDKRPVVLGVGKDEDEAFRTWRTTVRGRGVVVFAATDVLDDGFDWVAGPAKSGMASIKSDEGYGRMRGAIRAARAANPTDVLVVFLHAGVERVRCPTERQQKVARDFAADGADAVAMSHAHILQPFEVQGRTAVAYGLGNFIFAGQSEASSQSGVLTLTFPASGGPPKASWAPASIRSGIPTLVPASRRAAAVAAWQNLGNGC